MTVFLLAVGGDRFELYSEPPEEPVAPESSGRWRRWAQQAGVRWNALVDTARSGQAVGRFAKWRDRVICKLSETIAEQRTLWALVSRDESTLRFPSTMSAPQARAALDRALGRARRHHGIWLAIDLPLFIASAILAPIPGPNAFAYYLAFRVVGHWLSWRGARQSLKGIAWTLEPDTSLAELATLVDVPRAARTARVDAIAARLNLPRLSAFFERVTA